VKELSALSVQRGELSAVSVQQSAFSSQRSAISFGDSPRFVKPFRELKVKKRSAVSGQESAPDGRRAS
jgi:hypothetical protein